MGNKAAKKTNEMLGQQGQRYNTLADTLGTRGAEDRGYSTGSRGKIDQAYWDLYGGAGEGGGGGGGGPAYQKAVFKDPRENEAQAQYRDWSQSGGISPEAEATMRARASSGQGGYFEGIRNQLNAAQAGGGNVGYGSQLSKLARDQGRGLAESQLGAESDILGKRLEGRKWGTSGLERTDEGLIGRQMQVERERIGEDKAAYAAAQANAARGRAGAGDAFRNRMAILGELRGLRGEQGTDLAYTGQQLAALGGGTNTITNRVAEPSAWQNVIGGLGTLGGVGAQIYGMGGFGGGAPKRPSSGGLL